MKEILEINKKLHDKMKEKYAKEYIFNLMLEFRYFRHEAFEMKFDLDEFWSGTVYEILKEWLK